MKCISPLSIKDRYNNYITVPCGKCIYCLSEKRAEWTFRIKQELRESDSAFFITLKYNNKSLPIDTKTLIPQLDKKDCQLFLKRLRQEIKKDVSMYIKQRKVSHPALNWKLRYFLVGEYGPQTMRPHYHAILFNVPKKTIDKIEQIWGNGFVHVGYVSDASIHYCTAYVINRSVDYVDRVNPFSIMSRRPGLGYSYVEKNGNWHKRNANYYVINNNYKQKIPRFYKEKIFNRLENDINKLEVEQITKKQYWDRFEKVLNDGGDPYKDEDFRIKQDLEKFEKLRKQKKKL